MTTPATQPLLTDRDGRPVAQYWNPHTLAFEAAQGAAGAITVQPAGGTIATVTTLATAATLTTGNVQGILAQYINSTTTLAASVPFTGAARDLTATPRRNRVVARAFADQAGTLFIEQSRDGAIWRSPVGHSVAVAAGETRQLTVDIVTRWWRVRYVNGATPQGAFELLSADFGI